MNYLGPSSFASSTACSLGARHDLGPTDIAPLNYGENATHRVTPESAPDEPLLPAS